MARPLGELHDLVLERVRVAGPITARELAHGLQLNVQVACQYLHRMKVAGRLEVVDRVRVEHMTRPAVRYRAAHQVDRTEPWAILNTWPARAR